MHNFETTNTHMTNNITRLILPGHHLVVKLWKLDPSRTSHYMHMVHVNVRTCTEYSLPDFIGLTRAEETKETTTKAMIRTLMTFHASRRILIRLGTFMTWMGFSRLPAITAREVTLSETLYYYNILYPTWIRTLYYSNVVKRMTASEKETTVFFSRATCSLVNLSCLGMCSHICGWRREGLVTDESANCSNY